MKKLVSLLLACVMVLSLVSFVSAEESGLTTLRMYCQSQNNTVNGVSYTTEDWMNSDNRYRQAYADMWAKYGIVWEYDFVPEDQFAVVTQTRLVTGFNVDVANISQLDIQTRINMALGGQILAVDEIISQYCSDETKDFFTNGNGAAMLKYYALEDGHTYWLTHITQGWDETGYPTGNSRPLYIRYDWLQKLGLELPTTAEEFHDCLVAFQENDMNGNGEKDEVMTVGKLSGVYNGVAQWFGLGTDILAYIDPVTDQATSLWYEENFKEYIAFMQKLVEEGLVDLSNSKSAKVADNKSAATNEWGGNYSRDNAVMNTEGAPHACYVPILCTAIEGVAPQVGRQEGVQFNNDAYAVMADCADLAAIGRMIDCFVSDDFFFMTQCGLEGEDYVLDDSKVAGYTLTGVSHEDPMDKCRFGRSFMTLERVDRTAEMYSPYTNNQVEGDEVYNASLLKKCEILNGLLSYEPHAMHELGAFIAVATLDELDRIADLETDLDTLATETLSKLILGEYSLDDFDSYVAQLNSLGLKDYVEIAGNRYARTK